MSLRRYEEIFDCQLIGNRRIFRGETNENINDVTDAPVGRYDARYHGRAKNCEHGYVADVECLFAGPELPVRIAKWRPAVDPTQRIRNLFVTEIRWIRRPGSSEIWKETESN